jgi:hypothetical protein
MPVPVRCTLFQLIMNYWTLCPRPMCSFSINFEFPDFLPGADVQFFSLYRIYGFRSKSVCGFSIYIGKLDFPLNPLRTPSRRGAILQFILNFCTRTVEGSLFGKLRIFSVLLSFARFPTDCSDKTLRHV